MVSEKTRTRKSVNPKKGKGKSVSPKKRKPTKAELAALAEKRSLAAKKGAETRKANKAKAEREAKKAKKKRSEAAKKGWETRLAKKAEAEALAQSPAKGKGKGKLPRIEPKLTILTPLVDRATKSGGQGAPAALSPEDLGKKPGKRRKKKKKGGKKPGTPQKLYPPVPGESADAKKYRLLLNKMIRESEKTIEEGLKRKKIPRLDITIAKVTKETIERLEEQNVIDLATILEGIRRRREEVFQEMEQEGAKLEDLIRLGRFDDFENVSDIDEIAILSRVGAAKNTEERKVIIEDMAAEFNIGLNQMWKWWAFLKYGRAATG